MRKEDKDRIRAVLDQFATGWREQDAGILKKIWDHTCPESSYIAAENEKPVFGQEQINKYYDEALSAFPIISSKIDNVRINLLNDLAYAFCDISMGFKVKDTEFLVCPRATFVLRKRENNWCVIHYHESIKYEIPE
jgi:uncharacterized protein (TIGR02246 family)